eukprot:gene15414-biopygen5837
MFRSSFGSRPDVLLCSVSVHVQISPSALTSSSSVPDILLTLLQLGAVPGWAARVCDVLSAAAFDKYGTAVPTRAHAAVGLSVRTVCRPVPRRMSLNRFSAVQRPDPAGSRMGERRRTPAGGGVSTNNAVGRARHFSELFENCTASWAVATGRWQYGGRHTNGGHKRGGGIRFRGEGL